MIAFTRVKATAPACVTKRFDLIGGKLQKHTSASVTAGHMSVEQVADVHGFSDVLKRLTTDNCLLYGIPPRDAALVTEKVWVERGRPDDALPRSKDVLSWPAGPGVLLLDYDAPKDGGEPLQRDELLELLWFACPAARVSDAIWWPSTSSFIYQDDRELQGLRGQRIYLMVADASDIPRAGKALNERLWALGHGRFEVSASGSLLERPVFDGSVWQSNRIDFAAGAACGAGLSQHRGEPYVMAGESPALLDTRTGIPDLSAAEAATAKAAKAAARSAKTGEAEAARDEWLQEVADQIVASNPRMDRADAVKQAERAAERRDLMGDWVLQVRDEDHRQFEITVLEALDNPAKYHGLQTRDPLEPHYDGGRWVGKLFLYSARPCLYSMAHGGVTFRLSRQHQRIENVKGKGSETTDALNEVLRRSPEVFDFGEELVIVGQGGSVHRLDEHGLRYEAGKLTQFWAYRKIPNVGMVEELQDPPAAICRNVLSMGSRRNLKKLDAVVTAPTLRPDGTVLDRPGYDEDTRLLYEADTYPVAVPEWPTRAQAIEALDFLWQPFKDFPFVGALDRAVHLAAIITAAVRPILPTSPAFAYDAPVQGSGKTLLARCIGILTEGKDPSVWPHTAGRDDEEVRKRLFTVLRGGARSLIWDNVLGCFDSAALASCLTSPMFSDRILGASSSSTVPNRMVFLMTGNNLDLAGDLPRRVLISRIDPETDRPFARSFDMDPAAHCLAHRQRMVASALVLVRAMLTHGCSKPGDGKLASFEDWDKWVRQAVIYAGELRPGQFGDVMDIVVAMQAADPEQEALSHLLQAWHGEFGSRLVTTSEILTRATSNTFNASPLREALEEFVVGGKLTTKSVGRLLKYRVGRICSGKRLEDGGLDRAGVRLWRVSVINLPR